MSKWDKLIHKLKSSSAEIRYEELKKILEEYGYKARETSGGSSHITFRKEGCNNITVPRHKKIKRAYIELVRKVVEEEAKNEDDG
ncbi:MAG: type II toxin-antitoxin system HicA family toxin [Lachnospiraceae bacterium]|nr:type II toxin-antitoxin system HicA family toxin [Lachnospiraceae bacterium]MBQ7833166.1 type II toxin-antitoxin system HicA family toxin [Lachnospiraceae bacterium]